MAYHTFSIKLSFAIFLGIPLAACQTQRMNEAELAAQLRGAECRWLDTEPESSFSRAAYFGHERIPVQCRNVRFYDSFCFDHFKENCVTSGAKCLLALPNISPAARLSLETFLLNGPNDVNTGDGIKSIRGVVAAVYARIGGTGVLEVLEKSYARDDPLGVGSQASGVSSGGPRVPRTNGEIGRAIDFVKKKQGHNPSRDADATK